MPVSGRRRTRDEFEADDGAEDVDGPAWRRRRSSGVVNDEATGEDYDDEGGDSHDATAINAQDAIVQRFVRYALSCEYARQPIRRSDIGVKVFNDIGGLNSVGTGRSFKAVFAKVQKVLEDVFGMRMVELPAREKITISQRRAAQKVERTSASTKTWVLTTTLPSKFRVPEIIQPPQAPTVTTESIYVGFYTFVISLITLSGGTISEERLERYFRRMGVEMHTPIDRTERIIQRMLKEGYIIRNRSVDSGEEVIEYVVGPRGKVEVGMRGVAALVGEVYGFGPHAFEDKDANEMNEGAGTRQVETEGGMDGGNDENQGENARQPVRSDLKEFQSKLRRSLGLVPGEHISDPVDLAAANAEMVGTQVATQNQTQPRRSRRVSGRGLDDRDGDDLYE
ncbi:hypothetical protein KEM54_001522 [Ascosphaera aggregata]|nr:hypothetical protein KEM54_001522 [Ascosphaera aggregata]